ncbi:MAG: cytochrome c biogenesis heme-transporting ATPase CcmA [Candidatus Berkiellales bacterium]
MKFEVKNLSCQRAGKYLFRRLNFDISPGQLIVIQGFNGAGKSSLLKILAGIMLPEKGKLLWNKMAIDDPTSPFYEHISYLGHKDGLRQALTPIENINSHFALANAKITPHEQHEVLSALNLTAERDQPCEILSAGQRRKVMLAMVILKRKSLWILDEPFTAVDRTSCETLKRYFDQHLAHQGMIIMTSHTFEKDNRAQMIDLSMQENLC